MQYWTGGAAQLSSRRRGGKRQVNCTAQGLRNVFPIVPEIRDGRSGRNGAGAQDFFAVLGEWQGRRDSFRFQEVFVLLVILLFLSVTFAPVVDEFPPAGFPPVTIIIVVSTAFPQTVASSSKPLSPWWYLWGESGTES